MSVYTTSEAAADLRGIELYAPLGSLHRARQQVERFLLDYCTRYPDVPTTLPTHQPIYGRIRVDAAYATTYGHLEVQFQIVGTVYPPPGAIIEVVGYDWF